MRKWMSFSSLLVIFFVVLSFAFKPEEVKVPNALLVKQPVEVLYPKTEALSRIITPPFLGSTYIGFKEALAFKESQGNYFSVNTLGYLGKYQFGKGTLKLMGVNDAKNFLNDPILQEEVFNTNIARNKWILRREIKRFDGKRINGINITESGMLAAAHLAGPGNVKKYLHTYGQFNVKDAYGTSLAKYMKMFSGYDISFVLPKRNPKVSKI